MEVRSERFSRSTAWRSQAAALRNAAKLPAASRPWTGRPGVLLRGLRADDARTREVLDIGFALTQLKFPGRKSTDLAKGLWANATQSICRQVALHRPPTPTMNMELYSYERDCRVSGEAILRLMGWPRHRAPMEYFTEAQLTSLAGESFSVPTIAQLAFICFQNPFGAWWRSVP